MDSINGGCNLPGKIAVWIENRIPWIRIFKLEGMKQNVTQI